MALRRSPKPQIGVRFPGDSPCNTALSSTSVAVRQGYPYLPIVQGIEQYPSKLLIQVRVLVGGPVLSSLAQFN